MGKSAPLPVMPEERQLMARQARQRASLARFSTRVTVHEFVDVILVQDRLRLRLGGAR